MSFFWKLFSTFQLNHYHCNNFKGKYYHKTSLTRARNHETNAEIKLINENLTNEEEADFNDKYTRILVKYPKENNIKTTILNSNAGLDHSSETKHGNYAIEYCITSLGEYFYCYCITSFWSITMLCSEITGLWLMKYLLFSCLISC